jgi:hypothetical protein
MAAAPYRQQKVLSHFLACCWIDWLLMIKTCLIESGPPCIVLCISDSKPQSQYASPRSWASPWRVAAKTLNKQSRSDVKERVLHVCCWMLGVGWWTNKQWAARKTSLLQNITKAGWALQKQTLRSKESVANATFLHYNICYAIPVTGRGGL